MKISKRPTSLRALRTFCAAARHTSFKLAAEELYVTASAVSHQIKALEADLGVSLFDRSQGSLSLTNAGERLFSDVDPLIRQIDQLTSRLRSRVQRQTLHISVQPFFASELFVPRLSEFTALHPDIDMQIDTSDERSENHPATADVSIRVFKGAPANLVSDAFFPLRLMPACAPELYKKIFDKKTRMIRPFPMIVHNRRTGQWQRWLESSGIKLPEAASIVQLNSTVAVVRAAEQGLGVAIVPMPLSRQHIESGRLVPLHEHQAPTPERYYFASTPEAAEKPQVQALRKWVLKTFSPLA